MSENEQILSVLQKIPESLKNDMFLLASEKSKDEMLLASLKHMSHEEKKQAFLLAGLSAAKLFDGLQGLETTSSDTPDSIMDDVVTVVSLDDAQGSS